MAFQSTLLHRIVCRPSTSFEGRATSMETGQRVRRDAHPTRRPTLRPKAPPLSQRARRCAQDCRVPRSSPPSPSCQYDPRSDRFPLPFDRSSGPPVDGLSHERVSRSRLSDSCKGRPRPRRDARSPTGFAEPRSCDLDHNRRPGASVSNLWRESVGRLNQAAPGIERSSASLPSSSWNSPEAVQTMSVP